MSAVTYDFQFTPQYRCSESLGKSLKRLKPNYVTIQVFFKTTETSTLATLVL